MCALISCLLVFELGESAHASAVAHRTVRPVTRPLSSRMKAKSKPPQSDSREGTEGGRSDAYRVTGGRPALIRDSGVFFNSLHPLEQVREQLALGWNSPL